jgi:hypothetical protein
VTAPGSEDVKLADLRSRFPHWIIWRGKHTNLWWAMSPPGSWILLDGPDLDQLAAKIADIVAWERTGRS